jgi:hypothetical protein
MKVVKLLRLVPAEQAREIAPLLGAEAPVWASPQVDRRRDCERCGGTYAPLLYGAGRRTESVHPCAGIYHFHVGFEPGPGLRLDTSMHISELPIACVVPAEALTWGESDCGEPDPLYACSGGTWYRPERWIVYCGCTALALEASCDLVLDSLEPTPDELLVLHTSCGPVLAHPGHLCRLPAGVRHTGYRLLMREEGPMFVQD